MNDVRLMHAIMEIANAELAKHVRAFFLAANFPHVFTDGDSVCMDLICRLDITPEQLRAVAQKCGIALPSQQHTTLLN